MNATRNDIIDFDCGIAMGRITTWLTDELSLPVEDGAWVYSAGQQTCLIEVHPLQSRTLGAVNLERTHFIAHGDAEAIAELRKLFTLRFMSAGG